MVPRNVYSGREAAAANISICYINGNNGKVLLRKYLPSTWAMIARGPRDYLFLHARGKRRTERDTHTLNSRIGEFFSSHARHARSDSEALKGRETLVALVAINKASFTKR
jgi:hypothetical protein